MSTAMAIATADASRDEADPARAPEHRLLAAGQMLERNRLKMICGLPGINAAHDDRPARAHGLRPISPRRERTAAGAAANGGRIGAASRT